MGFPLLIKATAGGGGRGMRLVQSRTDFDAALESARREAQTAFGDAAVLLERAISAPRHVEFQILADQQGNIVHLGERDCSVQRKHQKVIEESPSPALDPTLRAEMGSAAVSLMRAARYQNAGTVEFLLTEEGRYYFLEVNTRLQVEHPVTEQVTGVDLVRAQLRVAAGEPLEWRQEEIEFHGHAIECRIYAEDPTRDYVPSTGLITTFIPPNGDGIRNDLGVEAGDEISPFYDSMVAKLIVTAPNRAACVQRALEAVQMYRVEGVATNLDLLRFVLAAPDFRLGSVATNFLDHSPDSRAVPAPLPEHALLAAAGWRLCMPASPLGSPWHDGPWRHAGEGVTLRFHDLSLPTRRVSPDSWLIALPSGDHVIQCKRLSPATILVREGTRLWTVEGTETAAGWHLSVNGEAYLVARSPSPQIEGYSSSPAGSTGTGLQAPMTGRVVKITTGEGETVAAGQTVLVIEAMKMEHAVSAPRDGTISRILYQVGDVVQAGASLAEMEG
jgi:3-methylcrotonyl-CoA carboxylase alpha subunit